MSSSKVSAYVGYRWRLVSIQTTTGTTEMPASSSAGLSFKSATGVLLHDGINVNNATYTASGQHITITGGPTTAAWYSGSDPTTLLAIAAVGQLSGAADGGRSGQAGLTMIDSKNIEISVAPYKLRLTRADTLTPETSQSPSPTR